MFCLCLLGVLPCAAQEAPRSGPKQKTMDCIECHKPSTGSGSSQGDGPCYDQAKDAYDACKKVTPSMTCYDLYVAAVAACDNA